MDWRNEDMRFVNVQEKKQWDEDTKKIKMILKNLLITVTQN